MSAGELLLLPPYSVMEARDHTAYRESSGKRLRDEEVRRKKNRVAAKN